MADEHDRRAILARRQILVAAAVAAAGCSLPDRPMDERVGGLPGLPDWREVDRGIPPLFVDQRLSEREKKELLLFAKHIELVYERMREAQNALAAAWRRPSDPALSEALGYAQRLFRREARELSPLCPGSEHTWVLLRRQVHQAFIQRQIEMLEAYVDVLPERIDTLGIQHRPCLTCSVDGPLPVREVLTFDVGQATFDRDADAILSGIDKDAERIMVNGHAGPEESERDVLSQKRAENVRARLIELGFPANRARARGCAEAVPLDQAWSPLNRRVDFDLATDETG